MKPFYLRIKTSSIVLLTLLIGLSLFYYHNTIFYPPAFIHAWTQSDRYAIALKFIDNHFDFFHPATYNLLTKDGITQVDFPINEFIVALLMKIFGTTAPGVFRIYTLLYGIIGIYFLYLLTKELTGSEWKAIAAAVFMFSSPVYSYYLTGFLPTVPALTNVIIGFYFFYKFISVQNNRHFNLAILFFTLAALMRLTFSIFLLAVISYQVVAMLKQKVYKKKLLLASCIGMLAVAGYFLYNKYLNYKYGTMFLTTLLPVHSWDNLKEILKEVWKNWGTEYLTFFHYVFFSIGLIFYFISEKKKEGGILIVLGISLLGSCLFFLLMGQQFIDHDYYFIDTFFPIILICFVLFLREINFNLQKKKYIAISILGLISLGAVIQSKGVLDIRYTDKPWDMYEATLRNFKGSAEFLDRIKIPQNAKMLVMDANTTNMPLIQMRRNGFTVITTDRKSIEESMHDDFDFLVLQNEFAFEGTIINYPELLNQFKLIGTNGKILIYKKTPAKITQTLAAFLGTDHMKQIGSSNVNGFDKVIEDAHWSNCKTLDAKEFVSPGYSLLLDSLHEFGPTYTDTVKNIPLKGKEYVWFSAKIKNIKGKGANVVFSIDDANHHNYHYASVDLRNFMSQNTEWKNIEYLFPVPAIKSSNDIIKVYIWNANKSTIQVDDLCLKFIKYQ